MRVKHPHGDSEQTIGRIRLVFWGEAYGKVKSLSHRVQVVFDSQRLDERAKGVDVDGEARTGVPQHKRLGRKQDST